MLVIAFISISTGEGDHKRGSAETKQAKVCQRPDLAAVPAPAAQIHYHHNYTHGF